MIDFNEDIRLRISRLVEESNLKKSRFATECGIDASNFGKKLEGKVRFTDFDLKQIATKLNLRISWLLSGEGQKYKVPEDIKQQVAIDMYRNPEKEIKDGIPLIPTNAMAGSLTGDSVQIMPYDIESYFIVPAFAKSDFCIRVDGKSMEPTYCKGDIIACKYVPMTDIWFQWGKIYVIATDQGVLVKHIEKGSDAEHIKLVSDNPEYMPFEIPTSGIYNIAVINGLIRVGDI